MKKAKTTVFGTCVEKDYLSTLTEVVPIKSLCPSPFILYEVGSGSVPTVKGVSLQTNWSVEELRQKVPSLDGILQSADELTTKKEEWFTEEYLDNHCLRHYYYWK